MNERLNELLQVYTARSENETDNTEIDVWKEAADMLRQVMNDLDVDCDILDCGCNNDEFGCQGAHIT